MNFKIGDKVKVAWPEGHEEGQTYCTVTQMGFSHAIMFVRKANGDCMAIYKRWASKIKPKNQQLLFDFMD